VLVKSFALEGRWIETRLLTKQSGQWAGYSYAWNDEQTEATLVDAAGLDRDFKSQKWHYPSRNECLVCHSRAANFVLGLTTLQMNKTHDYGGVEDNQLRVLEHLGMLRVDWMSEAHKRIREEIQAKGLTGHAVDEEFRRRTETRDQRERVPSALLAMVPERMERLADPSDAKADLGARARAYLHANCSNCHVEAGGGNALMDLEWSTSVPKMNLFGVKPLHDALGIDEAKLLDPGHPERSVLLERLSRRGRGQMPPLATSKVDEQAVKLLRDWIRSLPAK
jgi:mono/diheme cytochrome c family protein